MLETNTEIGDHYPGATATTGKICFTGSFDDLFHSDLILIWGGNPNYTHIPNVHFVNEARYHGARVVTIEIVGQVPIHLPDRRPDGMLYRA